MDEDTLTTADHGAPLLREGRLLAGYRDATFVDCPNVSTVKQWHIVVVSHRVAIGGGTVAEAAACDPRRIMLGGEAERPAHEVGPGGRCQRRACAALFAQADTAENERTKR
ncbi:hypothetical protein ACQP25_44695 (plasmid) [Microtetraspora malaysiensis]|uniref:hypothetical protein n=1 Tax=Microtetraspora malaysiensis TaxID=161358 RepID=UPI003D9102E3